MCVGVAGILRQVPASIANDPSDFGASQRPEITGSVPQTQSGCSIKGAGLAAQPVSRLQSAVWTGQSTRNERCRSDLLRLQFDCVSDRDITVVKRS